MSGLPVPAGDARAAPQADPTALIAAARAASLTVATAESLTGGALCARLVDVPGASSVVVGGAVCYSYGAKSRVLGVDPELLERDGAVNAATAEQMAQGALELYRADIALATTGVAGPGPDERGAAAGTVWLAIARRGGTMRTAALQLEGDRTEVRAGAVQQALELLGEELAGA